MNRTMGGGGGRAVSGMSACGKRLGVFSMEIKLRMHSLFSILGNM